MKSLKSMPFYEPGPYEEYVGKLSSIRVVPKPEVWSGINRHLDYSASNRRKLFIWRATAAAISILILLSVSITIISLQPKHLEGYSFAASDIRIVQPPPDHYIVLPERSAVMALPEHQQRKVVAEYNVATARAPYPQDAAAPIAGCKPKPLAVFDGLALPNGLTVPIPTEGKPAVHEANQSKLNTYGSPWSITAYLNPLYSSHTMAAMAKTNSMNETGVWLWGGELQVKRQLNKSLSLVTGITVNPTGQNVDNLILLYGGNIKQNLSYLYANTSYGQVALGSSIAGISSIANLAKAPQDVIKSTNLAIANLKQRFHHVEVPLLLSARLSGGGVDLDFRLGAAVGILVNNQFEVASSFGQYVGQTDGVKRYSAAAIGAVSIGLPLTKHVSFVVEPYFRLGLLTLDHYDPNTLPFNASVRFGLGYRF